MTIPTAQALREAALTDARALMAGEMKSTDQGAVWALLPVPGLELVTKEVQEAVEEALGAPITIVTVGLSAIRVNYARARVELRRWGFRQINAQLSARPDQRPAAVAEPDVDAPVTHLPDHDATGEESTSKYPTAQELRDAAMADVHALTAKTMESNDQGALWALLPVPGNEPVDRDLRDVTEEALGAPIAIATGMVNPFAIPLNYARVRSELRRWGFRQINATRAQSSAS